ncbi:MAG: hypothetical protein JWL97_2645 [Gemmatimonadales bacterium]|nr:hypothetical protein [Gemmatimonadales bacterium]
MCGIVGVLNVEGRAAPVSTELIGRMRDLMEHRGPDSAGTWIGENGRVGFGHRRLSIIDLSDVASQPMGNEDGSLQIVFNGEIYNHVELRQELVAIGGHTWRTDHSDTEVILHAFEQWGIDCVSRFRGMFAFALWDARDQALWLVRDRLGVKPLYYSRSGGRLRFASEIKAILADPTQPRAVNEEGLFHYLSFLTTPAPQTLYAGIEKLPNGCWMKVSADGTTKTHRYWDAFRDVVPLTDVPEAEVAERILESLRESVRLRSVSDVPVGIFLSGGVDSSTIAALFAERGPNVRTFSIGYDGEYASYTDELPYARRMANSIHASHHERRLTQDDLIEFLPKMISLQDEPIGDPVCVPVYYVSKLARDAGVIVCQVGEGADELFYGYPGWHLQLRAQRMSDWPVPVSLRRAGMAALAVGGRSGSKTYELVRRGAKNQPLFWGGAEAFTETSKRRLLSPRLRREFADLSSWEVLSPIRQRFEETSWEPTEAHWMTYLDLNLRLPELLLMRVDKMSMGASLEGRVPFLDHRFVELALGIPTAMKIAGGRPKHLLKRAVRGVIPDEFIDRKKQGFGVPVHEWLFDRLGATARDAIRDFCRDTDYLDERAALSVLDSGRPTKAWYLLNVALWWRANFSS